MAKKKDKPQVINNIQELNLEIDYEKLAEAIVKAQEKSTVSSESKNKIGFWKAVWLIIRNKESKSGNRTAYLLAEIMAWLFNAIAILGVVSFAIILFDAIFQMNWAVNLNQIISQAVYLCITCAFLLAISLIFRGIANEIKAEKDRNYIISLFSGLVSFVALIVALVALFKGVG